MEREEAKRARMGDGMKGATTGWSDDFSSGSVTAQSNDTNTRQAIEMPSTSNLAPATQATSINPTAAQHITHLSTPPTTPLKTHNPNFDLVHCIARDPSLLPHLTSFLNIPSIISLYAISKPFHYYYNRHYTSLILTSVRAWAPNADTVFPWRCYKSLCIKDPAAISKLRLQSREAEVKKKWAQMREVPSLRWLQMVVWREGVVQDMLIVMRAQGLLCPPGTLDAVKRMWLLMDLPLNSQRLALIRDKYMSDKTLKLFTSFLLKIDMLLTDPLHPAYPYNHPNERWFPHRDNGTSVSGIGLRKLLMAERQLTSLWRVVRGWTPDPKEIARPMTRLDMLRLWVRHKYTPKDDLPESTKKMSIMGIPWWEVGTAGLERTGVAIVPQKMEEGDEERDAAAKTRRPAVVLSNPSIVPTDSTALQQDQLGSRWKVKPQARPEQQPDALPPAVTSIGKPREQLLRPDELVMRECMRRGFKNHKMWIQWMIYGFVGPDGRNFPLKTEEGWVRCLRGMKEKVVEQAVEVPEREDSEEEDEEEDSDVEKSDEVDMSGDDEEMSGMTDMSDMSDMDDMDDEMSDE